MRVVFDCFKQVKGAGKSIGIYNVALNDVRNLVRYNGNQQMELVVFGNKHNREDFDIDGVEFVEIPHDPLNKLYCVKWELFDVASYYKKVHGDVIVFPRGYTTLRKIKNDIIIVHDLIPFFYDEHYPDEFNKLENAYIMARLKQSIKTADKVITISQASKNKILGLTSVPEEKITVINNGLNRVDVKPCDKENYIVAMTSRLPHKNAKGIVKSYEAYFQLSKNPLPLIIIGVDGVAQYGIDRDTAQSITCHRFIKSNDEMHALIGKAKMFLFLSEVEGFGLPPIEAMQLGVPVICSNCSSLPEVVGDAAILVAPHDYEQVAKEMVRLQDDESLQQELMRKGYENIKRFDWSIIAKQYRKVISDTYIYGRGRGISF